MLTISIGQASFGHYWIYIRDFERKIYRKYNDQRITEVPESEVMLDTTDGGTANPYFLVFIREDLAEQMVESVVRDCEDDETDDGDEKENKKKEESADKPEVAKVEENEDEDLIESDGGTPESIVGADEPLPEPFVAVN